MYLIYGGEDNLSRHQMNVVSWRSIKEKIVMGLPGVKSTI